jgi:LPXTG-site transpeptidase (sortase) family protein
MKNWIFNRGNIFRLLLIIALAAGMVSQPGGTVHAATLTVNNNFDSGAGSLRQAVTDAVSGDTITFNPSLAGQTILLTSGEISIDKSLTIDGSSLGSQVTISGNTASRIFNIGEASLALDSLKLINGKADHGGAILNNGTLFITNSTFSNNTATAAITLLKESFDGVTVPALPTGWTTDSANGRSDWTTVNTKSNSNPNSAFSPDPVSVSENELVSPSFTLSSALPLTFSSVYNLETNFDGAVLEIKIGAGAFQDILTAGGSFTSGGYNGTINSGTNPLNNRAAWTGNSSVGGWFSQTSVSLPAAALGQVIQLRWRVATDSGGPAGGYGYWIDDVFIGELPSQGGAIVGRDLDIANSTFNNNSADEGGAVYNIGFGSTVSNSTFSGNRASIRGGAIKNDNLMDASINISYSTISGNQADVDGGGIDSFYNGGNGVSFTNTILSNNTHGNCGTGTNYTSNDYNIVSDGTCGLSGTNDRSNTNPLIGPLANNGGPTQTFALLTGSPAINPGVNGTTCPVSDQRGVARPQGSSCDIGAYEFDVVTRLTVTIDQAAAQLDPTNTSPILFTAVFSAPVTDFATGDVSLSGTAGATTAAVSGSGTTYTVSVSGMTGNGTVIATVAAGVAHDASANPNEASTSTDNSVMYDISSLVVTASNPASGALLVTGPTQMSVTFNKDVKHASTIDPGSATNPANYLLVEDGANGIFNTINCLGGRVLDDTQITVNTATYDAATLTATLSFNNAVPLPDGRYRLFVCGTTSIEDLVGNKLNSGLSDTEITLTIKTDTGGIGKSGSKTTLPATGFAPNVITSLPEQPVEKAYTNEGIWLEIPSLGVKASIVGVPNDNGWDVTWLGNNAGWLNGTAFPTWKGNSVITGHVWDANNKPGIFVNLKKLKYGDRVKIHAWGEVYTYEVRETRLVSPSSLNAVLKHEDKAWVTLLTCEDFKILFAKYSYRRIVRAVLLSVTAE